MRRGSRARSVGSVRPRHVSHQGRSGGQFDQFAIVARLYQAVDIARDDKLGALARSACCSLVSLVVPDPLRL